MRLGKVGNPLYTDSHAGLYNASKSAELASMPLIMFWNMGRSTETGLLAAAYDKHKFDILILAECGASVLKVVVALNASVRDGRYFYEHRNDAFKRNIYFVTRLPFGSIHAKYDGNRYHIDEVRSVIGQSFLIATVHLTSKLYSGQNEQYSAARQLRRDIERVEAEIGNSRTVAIGDFNMNPFETGMIAVDGLHGVMDRDIASKRSRRFQDEDHSYFYNPMWGRLGDESVGPPGSYFYRQEALSSYYWHTFDQILLRPDLLDRFVPGALSVLTEIGSVSLLKSGRPDTTISDHLPLVVRLNLED